MHKPSPPSHFAGLRVTSLATLASRVLGLLRDMAIAALLGLGPVMDAYALAFRIPNLFRRLLGEGALAASYLPVFAAHWQRSPRAACQLASVLFTQIVALLAFLLLVLEGACWALAAFSDGNENLRLLAGLSAVMLPYMVLICLAAQFAATLHALGHFAWPALNPVVLNVALLAGAWLLAPRVAADQAGQAYVLAWCLVAAGVMQLLTLWRPMRRAGFVFDYNYAAAREGLRHIAWAFLPMLFGLAVTQLNTLADSLIAWLLSAPSETSGSLPPITWLPGEPAYPLATGAVSAVYYGERMYQFPLGMLGVAVATVVFPRFSRHAAQGHMASLGADLIMALRLIALLALPASIGLVLLAEPIAALFFKRGEFTAADALRTARMIAGYGAGVWAYCALPVLVRAYYALGKSQTPAVVGAAMCAVNFALNLVLVWPLAELGLAVSTALAAAAQLVWLLVLLRQHLGPLPWQSLRRTLVRASIATGLMALVTWQSLSWLSQPRASGAESEPAASTLLQLALPLVASAAVYLLAIWFAPGGRDDWRLLLDREPPASGS